MESLSKPNQNILTGLQAFLQLLIMLYHFFALHSPETTKNPDKMPEVAVNGYTAVGLFFALSGFMAGYTSFKRFANLTCKNYCQYIVKRFSRLAFLYYASLIIGVVCILDSFWNHQSFLQLTILVPGFWFWNQNIYHWNAPLWFVSQLMIFYFLAPVLINFLRKRSKTILIILLFVCYAVPLGGFATLYFLEPPTRNKLPINKDHIFGMQKNFKKSMDFYEIFVNQAPYFNIWQFGMGLILGIYLQNFPFKPVAYLADILTALFCGSLIFCATWAYANNTRFLAVMYWDRFVMFPLWAAWFVSMTIDTSSFSKYIFDNPVMQKFGKASYALYVMHNPVWRWLRVKIDPKKVLKHKIYKYTIFGRNRLEYSQFPFALFAAVCISLVMYELDSIISPRLSKFLVNLLEPKKQSQTNFPAEGKSHDTNFPAEGEPNDTQVEMV